MKRRVNRRLTRDELEGTAGGFWLVQDRQQHAGDIGQTVAQFLQPFGVELYGIASEAREVGAIPVTSTLHSTDAAVDVVCKRVEAALATDPETVTVLPSD